MVKRAPGGGFPPSGRWQNPRCSCDSNKVLLRLVPLRGYLKTFVLFCVISAFVFQAISSPLALVVLNTAGWGSGQPPADWQVKVNHGRPDFSVCTDQAGPCLHLKSVHASFGLERKVDVAPSQMPYLTWHWKVTQLPSGGDFRHTTTDDQAAQVLVAFDDSRIITYIWDSSAPKGTATTGQLHSFSCIFSRWSVNRAGADANQWVAVKPQRGGGL